MVKLVYFLEKPRFQTLVSDPGAIEWLPELLLDLRQREAHALAETNQRNLQYFEQEVEKLEGWADDLNNGLEKDIGGIWMQLNDEETNKMT